MDYLFIEKCARELEKLLKGKRIKGITLENKDIHIDTGKISVCVRLSEPNRIYLCNKKGSGAVSLIRGAFIKKISTLNKDRVIHFELVKVSPSGNLDTFHLMLELTGRNANAVLTDSHGTIIKVAREFPGRKRTLKKGEAYMPPPVENKRNYEDMQKSDFDGLKPEELFKKIKGLSPLNCTEIKYIYSKADKLDTACEEFFKKHEKSNSAYIYIDNSNNKYYLTTFVYDSLSNLKCIKVNNRDTPCLECCRILDELIMKKNIENMKTNLISSIKENITYLESELRELENIDNAIKRAEKLRKLGELLKSNMHKLKKGQKLLKVHDHETNAWMNIELDPSITPSKNLEKIFNDYKKLIKRIKASKEIAETIKNKIEKLASSIKLIHSANTKEELERIKQSLPAKIKQKRKLLKYRLSSGKHIIVGRNRTENAKILREIAKPWDLWFHARDIPGSHIILKLDRGEKPDTTDILEAASAAAYFSKGKEDGKVTVNYTKVSNLRKVKGLPEGYVTYRGEKTITVKPKKPEEAK